MGEYGGKVKLSFYVGYDLMIMVFFFVFGMFGLMFTMWSFTGSLLIFEMWCMKDGFVGVCVVYNGEFMVLMLKLCECDGLILYVDFKVYVKTRVSEDYVVVCKF